MIDVQVKRLAQAVHRWLSFQNLCNWSTVFSESYLLQPIAEFMSSHHRGNIEPGLDHPQFAKKSNVRHRQVYFGLITPHSSKVETVIEARWVSDKAYSRQDVLDDLLRLECFRDSKGHVNRYFIIAGLRTNFDKNFRDLRYGDGTGFPFTAELLDLTFGAESKTIEVFSSRGKFRVFYKKFCQSHETDLPTKFKTALIARSRLDNIAVYMWQIGSMQKRRSFDPAHYDW